MFTLEQIQLAQKKVKTGEDFPNFIQNLISLGVKGYATIVSDGRVTYYGENDYTISSEKKYEELPIAHTANKELFIEFLLSHQGGETDYFTFCQQAAACGIAKWYVDIIEMTCTYSDSSGDAILIEKIPE